MRKGVQHSLGQGLVLAVVLAVLPAGVASAATPRTRPGRVVVRFRDVRAATAKADALGAVERSAARGVRLVRLPAGRRVGSELASLRGRADVAWAEPDYVY